MMRLSRDLTEEKAFTVLPRERRRNIKTESKRDKHAREMKISARQKRDRMCRR